MIIVKSPLEIEAMRRAGAVVGQFFEEVCPMVRAGVSTRDLDDFSIEFISRRKGVKAAFKGYHGYPANLCVSLNEEVVHGIPNPNRVLQDGDIVSIDFGVFVDGFCGDSARTFSVGEIDPVAVRLLESTERSLRLAIENGVREGNRVGDISRVVQETVEADGFSVVRDFVGHGIGRKMHEEPQVPNFGTRGTGPRLLAGMVVAIEPMINEGTYEVEVLDDGWTVVTLDRKRSAHFEHTVAVTKDGYRILSLP